MLDGLKRFGLDGFILGLIGTVVLAWEWPELGRTDGLINLQYFTQYGIALVFLLYGLTLSPKNLRDGVVNWRLHLVAQFTTFLLFPLLVYVALLVAGHRLPPALALGFFFLAALPSTVSSSVAMTSIAKGNVAGAIFNASLSSLIGVFLTPLLVNFYLHTQGASLALGDTIIKIMLLVLLPIVLGQLLRPLLLGLLTRHLRFTRFLDRATILAIVLNSFSDSVAEGVWARHGLRELLTIAVLSVLLFAVMYWLSLLLSQCMKLNREDRIAAVFCGSKKSLAAGAPMAALIFAGDPELGLIIAPLMLYHLLQLIIVSILARRLAEH